MRGYRRRRQPPRRRPSKSYYPPRVRHYLVYRYRLPKSKCPPMPLIYMQNCPGMMQEDNVIFSRYFIDQPSSILFSDAFPPPKPEPVRYHHVKLEHSIENSIVPE